MLIKALADFYAALAKTGKVRWGYSYPSINAEIVIDGNGEIVDLISLGQEFEVTSFSKKTGQPTVSTKTRFPTLEMPAGGTRTSGTSAQFLWDNSEYLLGVKLDKKRVVSADPKKFRAATELHRRLLSGTDIPAAKALLAFFDKWQPEKAAEHPKIKDNPVFRIASSVNFTFRYIDEDERICEHPEVKEIWDRAFEASLEEGPEMQCLVTGEIEHIPLTHNKIKQLHTTPLAANTSQSSGTSLVSFNDPAFVSYGFKQNMNAPIGARSAFAYVEAINYMLKDNDYHTLVGDRLNVLYWTTTMEPAYQTIAGSMMFGYKQMPSNITSIMKALLNGEAVPGMNIDPSTDFYILGMTPNGGRNAVKFFMKNSFGDLIKNVNEHYERLEIETGKEPLKYVSLMRILRATTFKNDQHAAANPRLEEQMLSAILHNTPYPASLINNVSLRVRTGIDKSATSPLQAAIIKAYYLKRPNKNIPQEILTMSLNPNSDNVAYNLGRLFAMYEYIQYHANNENITITPRYYRSASTLPRTTFVALNKLAQIHLDKLSRSPMTKGKAIFANKIIAEIKDKLDAPYPKHFTAAETNAFDLGYYHQKNALFVKKTPDNENTTDTEKETDNA